MLGIVWAAIEGYFVLPSDPAEIGLGWLSESVESAIIKTSTKYTAADKFS